MTLIARFSRAGTDDTTFDVEVEDIVFDFDCIEDATTDKVIAGVSAAGETGSDQDRQVFWPVGTDTWFDTLTVVPKRFDILDAAVESLGHDDYNHVPIETLRERLADLRQTYMETKLEERADELIYEVRDALYQSDDPEYGR